MSAPCPPFSASGRRKGLQDAVYQGILDAITHLAEEGCACAVEDLATMASDPRVVLMTEVAGWTFGMPDLEWVVLEQVPACEFIWEDYVLWCASRR